MELAAGTDNRAVSPHPQAGRGDDQPRVRGRARRHPAARGDEDRAHGRASLPGIGERLFAEAQAVNLINHPNIVAITEIVEPTKQHPAFALVMELLEGQLLADVIAAEGRLAPARFLPILAQVCDGLAAVHAAGLRAPRPQAREHLPRRRAGPPRLREAARLRPGQGAARRRRAADRDASRGRSWASPAYTSPEQAHGQARRPPHRHLRHRHHAPRAGHGAAAVPGGAASRTC